MLSTGSRQCVTKRRRNFSLHKKPYAAQIYPYCITEMCILKLRPWFLTSIGFILCICNAGPAKNRPRVEESISKYSQAVSVSDIRGQHASSFLGSFCWKPNSRLGRPSPHSILSSQVSKGLDVRPLVPWKQRNCESCHAPGLWARKAEFAVSLSWHLCLSPGQTVGPWSFSLPRLFIFKWQKWKLNRFFSNDKKYTLL